MEPDEYQRLFHMEDELWWFLGMREISTSLLGRFLPKRGGQRAILDAGCGTGGMLGTLRAYGKIVGADSSEKALALARGRGQAPLVQADVCRLPFASQSFDLVTCFDVLYHLRVFSDREALLEIARILRPGGVLLLRVPALKLMRGRHDIAVHTRQRYEKRELVCRLRLAGLVPDFVSYVNFFLLPMAIVRRAVDRWLRPGSQGSEVEPIAPWLNRWLLRVLTLESKFVGYLSLPVGLSLVAVARKRDPDSDT
jgi:SAM-dependent methyltransferase